MENSINIDIIVSLLKENKIRYIVISPGGTNIAFVKAVQDDDFFKCYSIVDERSAMYFAIGLYLQTGEVVATSCTSAQATRNYIPGLTEAFYKQVPILAITMKKHPRFTYQEYMQAPDQTSLPIDCVKKSIELPYIRDENDILHSIRLVNEAILELTKDGLGPVQLCVPWLDFPLNKYVPSVRKIERYDNDSNWEDIKLDNYKIMIIVGEHRPFTNEQINLVDQFCENNDAFVYVNHLSNFHGKYALAANRMLFVMENDIFYKIYKPDLIITIGGQTGDYPLYKKISQAQNIAHWRISENGNIVDTYDKLTKIFKCKIETFFTRIPQSRAKNHHYFELWKEGLSKIKITSIEVPFSNIYIAANLCSLLPKKSYVNFAILNSLRVWSLFEVDPSIICFSNVAAFGIDGGMSTLVGQSMETEELCFMITGDLAFFYDMNCLAIRHIKSNVRILLINNNGGIEFKLHGKNNQSIDRYIAAANHFHNAEGWAVTCGFEYISAHNKKEFLALTKKFIEKSDSPIVFEIFVSDKDEALAYNDVINAYTQLNLGDMTKKAYGALIKRLKG